ncbi:MAG: hypothetical protein Q7S62_02355 [bacterium]|nr:hypothetical protein [bacterium]
MPRTSSFSGTLLVPSDRRGPSIEPKRLKLQKEREAKAEEKKAKRLHRDAEEEIKFLRFVCENPGTPSGQAYTALELTDTTGSSARDALAYEGSIRVTRKNIDGHLTQCLSITPAGEKTLRNFQKLEGPLSEGR